MKTKTFKTKTNGGHIVHVKVRLLEKFDMMEQAILIDTVRLVPIDKMEMYNNVNSVFPTFASLRKTERYVVLFSRTVSFKLSTFKEINRLIEEMI